MTAKKERVKMGGKYYLSLLGPGINFFETAGGQEYVLAEGGGMFRVTHNEEVQFWERIFNDNSSNATFDFFGQASDKGIPVRFDAFAGPPNSKRQWAYNIEPVGEEKESANVVDVDGVKPQVESSGSPRPLTELFV